MWQRRGTDSILIVLTKISWAKMRGKNVSQNVKKNILFASAIITSPNNLIIKVSEL